MNFERPIMSLWEIEAYNQLNIAALASGVVDLCRVETSCRGEALLEALGRYALPVEPRFDSCGEYVQPKVYQDLLVQMNWPLKEDWFVAEYGVAVDNVFVRTFPTLEASYRKRCEDNLDRFSVTLLKFGEPVIIWHYDQSKEWAFIQNRHTWGWVKMEQLAKANRTQWLFYVQERYFLQVVASRVVINYQDFQGQPRSQLLLMGTRLSYFDQINKAYVLSLPQKNGFGQLVMLMITIPKGPDFYQGYLPFSPARVLEQGLKMISEPYGWGGADYYRDCTSLVDDIFGTFGFSLARNSTQQQAMALVQFVDSKWNEAERKALLQELPLGTVLYFPGHAMIYMGFQGGHYRILHSIYQMGVPIWSDMVVHRVKRVMIGHLEQHRATGERFLDEWSSYWKPYV